MLEAAELFAILSTEQNRQGARQAPENAVREYLQGLDVVELAPEEGVQPPDDVGSEGEKIASGRSGVSTHKLQIIGLCRLIGTAANGRSHNRSSSQWDFSH